MPTEQTRQPDAWRHPRLGLLKRGRADRLVTYDDDTPLFITADKADQLVAESTPLWLTEAPA